MSYDFKELVDNYQVLLQIKDYVLTVDGTVLKKNKNGKYEQANENDKFANEMRNVTNNSNSYINYVEEPEIGEK